MLIETSDLRKVYGNTVAVDSLTLSVAGGEVFGFLGPNGAGKTTTVKMLLGLVHPTSGRATVLGKQPGHPSGLRRIGFLPEHLHFHSWLTAASFLDLHGRFYGLTAGQRRERIPRLLAQVDLADRADTRLSEFSKGMTQRIGLAQALLNEPALVFLDEPTSGLDPVGRREVRDLIRELRNAGVTVFLNSHFLSEVEVTCDRVAIVKRGRVARAGSLNELTGQSSEVEIRVGGLTPELVAGLIRWGQITSDGSEISIVPDECSRLVLAVASEDVLPAVADWLVQGGARLYALAPRHLSLEELFMRTMAEES
jgi:ABC-2 type transport system ATP-binding protein